MVKKELSILLAIVMMLCAVIVVPMTVTAQEADIADEGVNLDLAETGNPYENYKYAKDPEGHWANCTYWAWQYAYEYDGVALPAWGDGRYWYGGASGTYPCDKTPSAHSIMCTGDGYYGHVAYVTDYDSANGKVYIKQGGYRYSSDGRDERWVSAYPSDLQGYIHLGGNPNPTPPTKPNNLRTTSGRNLFKSDEYIEFAWDICSTANSYWIYMWKDGKQIYDTNLGNNTTFTSAPTSAGNYTLLVRAGNNYGYGDESASFSFVVTDTIPDKPNNLRTTSNKVLFRVDESIEFGWDKLSTADSYWVYMWKDGKQIYDTYNSNNTTFTSAPTSSGKYTILVRAGNSYGYSDESASFSFVVTDKVPGKPNNLRTLSGKSFFGADENIEFTWDKLSTADSFWIYMWKDGKQIFDTYLGNNTSFTYAPTNTGNYTLLVRAGNSYGYSDGSASLSFIVNDKFFLGDVDGDGKVTIIDATCIQRKLANIPMAIFIDNAADADEDGELTILDATTIQRWLAQLPSNDNIGKPIT